MFLKIALSSLVFGLIIGPQTLAKTAPVSSGQKAYVVDDRLSALRRDADTKSRVLQRLRLGRAVVILESKGARGAEPAFYRVAVTRRTRGWLHQSSVAVPGRPREDERLLKLAEGMQEAIDRVRLYRLFIERFNRSALMPRALMRLGEDGERAADLLTRRARRRLAELTPTGARLKDYYLNDAGLDRFSKLDIKFDFDEGAAQYLYDGQAYREVVKRFPRSREAEAARVKLGLRAVKTARQ